MPTVPISMRKLKEILRLKYGVGLSHRQIGRSLAISPSVVSRYANRAAQLGIKQWPLPTGWDDTKLKHAFLQTQVKMKKHSLPDWATVHRELRNKCVTLQLLWEEYCERNPGGFYSYNHYCRMYREWLKTTSPSMRQVHKAGEKLFVDYCGPTVGVTDPETGEIRTAQVIVAVLGASSYTWAEATWSQQLEDWVMSHVRCFQWLGGVPELVVPDNLKSATSRACKYDPDVNPTYQQMLEHYNVAVLPARPRKPKDKAKAEVGVQVVERWIMARIRHEIFYSLASLNQRIRELLERLNNKIMQKLGYSRAELFIQLDKPALKPLPEASYSYTTVKKVRVHADYHVEIDKHYYSVPCSLLGQQLEAWISGELVRLFNQGQEVAVHPRKRTYGYSTRNEHMPEAHRQHATWTPERLLEWAGHIGSETHSYVLHILNSRPHPEQSYRFCLGLLNLHKKYSKARLNAACARALKTKVWRLSGIKSITEKVWINNLFRIQNQICYPRWNTKTYAAVSITTDTGSMMNHLYEQLTALKLTGFRDALKKQLAQPGTYQELGFEERLSLLTAEELTCRENRKAERLIKHARFRLNAELSKLDYRNNRGLDRALIRSLSQGNWLTLKQNILLTGATGSGKTFWHVHLVIMPADRDTRSTIIALKR
ncbi:hypothetical protein EIMP302_17140 [Escherichia coli]|nr:hypothetical protein EIMP302_17140 [Escherichia coli]